ncbi:MAG: hypothetical protein QOE89_3400, partial [Pseudonocardiales bacterium]|nr:hypothetical protein [Pseudonocardiales bacterium]
DRGDSPRATRVLTGVNAEGVTETVGV